MTNYEILKSIENVANQNLFINYIIDRVEDDNYRGIQISQHNRLTYNYCKTLIDVIYKTVGDKSFIIHVGDDNGTRQLEAEYYYKIVSKIKESVGKGTINSIKKNTFPDLARAGLIDRFDRNNDRIVDAITNVENKVRQHRSCVYKVSLSKLGLKFATAKNEFERRKYFTDTVDCLTKSAATELVELLTTDERFETIDILEFMFILSDSRKGVRYNDKLMYLSEYRRLTDSQRNQICSLLKEYCDPKRNVGTKVHARDFSNWKNESQQIFGLLGNSTYFKVINGQLMLNDGNYGLFTQPAKRKQKPRDEYFNYHNIEKRQNYELHHIIPFKRAINKKDAQYIDDKRNLIYLSSEKHAEFTTSGNINIRASFRVPMMSFLRINDIENSITVDLNKKEALLSTQRIDEIVTYNKQLLQLFYSA